MALGLADAGPVSCAVDGAAITGRIDKGFQQEQELIETREPVRADAALTQRQHFRCKVRQMAIRQDQKAAIVGDEFEAPVLVPEVPSNPLVARSALQRRCREAQQRNPFMFAGGDIPERMAYLRQVAK
jgi:hypothetical protein